MVRAGQADKHVPNVGAEDGDALDDGEEDVGVERRARGETDDHDGAAGAEVVDGLLVRSARRGGDDGGVWAEAVGRGLDVLDEILGLAEVDPLFCAELQDEVALVRAGVCRETRERVNTRSGKGGRTDGEDTEAHGDGVLNSEMAEAASGAGEDDPVADAGFAVLDRTVDSYTLWAFMSDLRVAH